MTYPWNAGDILTAADLNAEFGSKADYPTGGSDGQALIKSGTTTAWGAAGGKLIQLVRATDTTNRATNSTSYSDVTGMSVTISPTVNTHAVLIVASFSVRTAVTSGSPSELRGVLRITDASNNAISGAQFCGVGNIAGSGGGIQRWVNTVQLWAYATPATTSAVTYKLQFLSETTDTTVTVENASATGQMLALEIAS
jgi:hypothetical protein